jgi:hypothetical protein
MAQQPGDCGHCQDTGQLLIDYTAPKSEEQLQAQIVEYHRAAYPEQQGLLFHVNNKARNRIEGNKMKAMGVQEGVSDLVWLCPGGVPLLLEVKFETGDQTPAQKRWQHQVDAAGYRYQIVRTLSQAAEIFHTLTPQNKQR